MTLLALIRHAPTTWNAEGRLQGRRDTPLSEEGAAMLAEWAPPVAFSAFDWRVSPLSRTRRTARALAGRDVPTDDRLIEMVETR